MTATKKTAKKKTLIRRFAYDNVVCRVCGEVFGSGGWYVGHSDVVVCDDCAPYA